MFSSNKILSIIFVLLFLVLIGEVVYLMTIGNQPSLSKKPTPSIVSTKENILRSKTESFGITAADIADYRYLMQKKLIISSLLKTEFYGVIDSVEISSTPKGNVLWKLVLANEQGDEKFNFLFIDRVFNKVKIVEQTNNKERAIDFNQLKKGDRLDISYTVNLAFDNTSKDYLYESKLIRVNTTTRANN